jgi:hypothetical protein
MKIAKERNMGRREKKRGKCRARRVGGRRTRVGKDRFENQVSVLDLRLPHR